MPSSGIQRSFVTYWSPALERSKSASMKITLASTPTVPATTAQRAQPGGRKAPSRPVASGMKSTMVRWMVSTSARDDQEVEGQAEDADEQEQRVAAQVAGLDRAGEGRARAHDAGRAAGDHALHEVRLHDPAAEASEGRGGAHEHRLVELVEVPLVDEEGVRRVE